MIYCHHLVKKKEVSVTKVLQTIFRLVIRTWLYLQWSLSCWLKSGRNGAATIATVMENKVGEKKTTKRNSDSNKLTKNCLQCSAHVCLCWAILLIGPSACGWKPRENVTNIGTKRSSSRSFFFPSISSPTEQSAYSQNSSGNATRESTAMRDGVLDESRRWKLHLLARLLIWSKITRYGNKTASEYSSILSRR